MANGISDAELLMAPCNFQFGNICYTVILTLMLAIGQYGLGNVYSSVVSYRLST